MASSIPKTKITTLTSTIIFTTHTALPHRQGEVEGGDEDLSSNHHHSSHRSRLHHLPCATHVPGLSEVSLNLKCLLI